MRSFAMSLFAVLAFLPTVCQAQLFPRLFGGKQTQQVGSSCPDGVCPTAAPQGNYRSVGAVASIAAPFRAMQNRAGHWSYPGSIDSHLEGTHGVSTAGMTHQQKLDLHDSLHEGTAAPRRSNYPAVSNSVGYGSSGVRVSGYGSSGSAVGLGSSGSLAVGTVLSDGAVVTSVGVTVAAKTGCGCGCANCTCSQANQSTVSALRIGDRARLMKVMMAAAREVRGAGPMDTDAINRMRAAMVDAALEELGASSQAIDIDKWIEIIEKLIPLILKLIELFGLSDTFVLMPYV